MDEVAFHGHLDGVSFDGYLEEFSVDFRFHGHLGFGIIVLDDLIGLNCDVDCIKLLQPVRCREVLLTD